MSHLAHTHAISRTNAEPDFMPGDVNTLSLKYLLLAVLIVSLPEGYLFF